jgi:hypothetical protein
MVIVGNCVAGEYLFNVNSARQDVLDELSRRSCKVEVTGRNVYVTIRPTHSPDEAWKQWAEWADKEYGDLTNEELKGAADLEFSILHVCGQVDSSSFDRFEGPLHVLRCRGIDYSPKAKFDENFEQRYHDRTTEDLIAEVQISDVLYGPHYELKRRGVDYDPEAAYDKLFEETYRNRTIADLVPAVRITVVGYGSLYELKRRGYDVDSLLNERWCEALGQRWRGVRSR